MALIVETGEGLADAQSFVSVAEARAFASLRGLSLPSSDSDLEVLLRNSHDYILSLESKFKGRRKNSVQALPFPRLRLYIEGELIPDNVIPQCVKSAACQLTADSQDIDLMPISTGDSIVEEKVGPITVKYNGTMASGAPQPQFPRVLAMLAPVMLSGGVTRTLRI